MKKNRLFSAILFVFLIAASYILLTPHLKYDILLKAPSDHANLPMTLFYSDVTMKKIQAFSLSNYTVKPLKISFKSYTEGFVQATDYKRIMTAVNALRKTEGLSGLTYFHDYYEDDTYFIVSFTGGLAQVYVIDKKTSTAHHLKYTEADNLGNMYVSHIKHVGNEFILLGGEVNAYNAIVYYIDDAAFSVKHAVKLATHPSAIHEEHYAIDAAGNSLFINGNKLQILPPDSDKSFDLPLPIEAHNVFAEKDQALILSFTSSSVYYLLLNNKLQITKEGMLPLPNKNVTLINAFVENNHLALLSYDPAHKLYKNYVSFYDLATNKLTSCLGLRQYGTLALLRVD